MKRPAPRGASVSRARHGITHSPPLPLHDRAARRAVGGGVPDHPAPARRLGHHLRLPDAAARHHCGRPDDAVLVQAVRLRPAAARAVPEVDRQHHSARRLRRIDDLQRYRGQPDPGADRPVGGVVARRAPDLLRVGDTDRHLLGHPPALGGRLCVHGIRLHWPGNAQLPPGADPDVPVSAHPGMEPGRAVLAGIPGGAMESRGAWSTCSSTCRCR